jgi:hypothetical protein
MSTITVAEAELRTRQAIAVTIDTRDPDSIAKARYACSGEAAYNRSLIEGLASSRLNIDTAQVVADAADRLVRLLQRMDMLDILAKVD